MQPKVSGVAACVCVGVCICVWVCGWVLLCMFGWLTIHPPSLFVVAGCWTHRSKKVGAVTPTTTPPPARTQNVLPPTALTSARLPPPHLASGARTHRMMGHRRTRCGSWLGLPSAARRRFGRGRLVSRRCCCLLLPCIAGSPADAVVTVRFTYPQAPAPSYSASTWRRGC